MKLLVTGGAGFIGSHFINHWLSSHPDDSITNLDNLTYAASLANLQQVQDSPRYKFIKGDISDMSLVEEVIEGVEIVVHFAAETHVDRSILDPWPFVQSNLVGTYTLLEVARRENIKRFHHISTDEVFGTLDLNDKNKFNENTLYNPRSPYSATKAGSDHLVRAYYYTYGLPITISNCSNNFGPAMYPEKLIPLAITNALEHKKIPIHGDGKNERDWLFVNDHVSAIDLILQKGKIGETYLVGGLRNGISNLDIVKKILVLVGESEDLIKLVPDRLGNDRRYDIDWSKIKNELGWEPKHDLDEALKITVEWYKKNESWWKKIKSGEFKDYYKKQFGNLDA
ncbi:MAG: dTDP-glucose 4,6-dehydratase [Candidatus Levybacteria bacterium RIFCSPLOWO2_01_FULL_36_13]|nr:MAG: dTDP-glucose 4,6-dehydratase [Candidatus Levybacteria bacterium RIFCSPHIGHO2_01_FULL_36_15b]OGH35864.1 MAG: dTDP-glucose 4,6-dehydratase [Candidatus Levybacteria bacterium RIFCSPLOWO2_01_FULL_36_13]